MRLTDQQRTVIRVTVAETFGAGTDAWLFGSRVDDNKRGGDIDLLIETNQIDVDAIARAEIAFLSKIQMKLGEQKIDVLLWIIHRAKPDRPFLPLPNKRAFCYERRCFNTSTARRMARMRT